MGQIDALRMVEHIRERMVDLAVAENYLRDDSLMRICRNFWTEGGGDGGLVSDLWVEGAFPSKLSPDSLESLTSEGVVPSSFLSHLAKLPPIVKERFNEDPFPVNRELYRHQSNSIRICACEGDEKPTVIISAGTGSGKTEAFIIPMLADLWNAPPRTAGGGMRALVLYPMNALVADQVKRLHEKWLVGQNNHTLFHFTSETPEDKYRADKDGEELWEHDPFRIRTRQEARGKESRDGQAIESGKETLVPEIVITNYSMLEYMLCRPQDSCFFGPDLRCIILDEAHLYTGTLAAEITLLLRRVMQRCGVESSQVLQIATSATLGGTPEDLREYAAKLFSSSPQSVHVVLGERRELGFRRTEIDSSIAPSAEDVAKYGDLDLTTITSSDALIDDAPESVEKLIDLAVLLSPTESVIEAQETHRECPARFLEEFLSRSHLVHRMGRYLAEEDGNILKMDDLAQRLFPTDETEMPKSATALLLRLAASARKDKGESPLIPHRLHLLVRAPEGLSLCLNKECSGPGDFKSDNWGCIQATADRCRHCGHVLLPLFRCNACGQAALAAYRDEFPRFMPLYRAPKTGDKVLCFLSEQPETTKFILDSSTGEAPAEKNQTDLWVLETDMACRCPICETDINPSSDDEDEEMWHGYSPLSEGKQYALSVISETILHDLPELPDDSKHWKPGGGRRLLCFSDSRRAAARLGPTLTNQHEIGLLRALIANAMEQQVAGGVATLLEQQIKSLREQLKHDIPADQRRYLDREVSDKERDLANYKAGEPFPDLAARVANAESVKQILGRSSGENHRKKSYKKLVWQDNHEAVVRQMEGLLATELGHCWKKQETVESAGLIEFVYPGLDSLKVPGEFFHDLPNSIRSRVDSVWPDYQALLLDSVRMNECIAWSQDTEGRKWPDESPLRGLWSTRNKGGWTATAFVGATVKQVRRAFTEKLLRACGFTKPDEELQEISKKCLESAFDQLFDNAMKGALPFLQAEPHHQVSNDTPGQRAIRIILDKVCFRRPRTLFRCNETGTIWTHSAGGYAPVKGCLGNLEAVRPQALDADPKWARFRRDFRESAIFRMGLWAKEHSAQLSPKDNRRLQELFAAGILNVLSSTTTMELGIDIGGLNGVLLGNVPPGPANHKQRSGRAGRRADGSSIVVTYAKNSSFDRDVFRRFGTYLSKPLRTPRVLLDRERIIRRHLHAALLSEFMTSRQTDRTGTMQAFGKMESFCGVSSPEFWRKHVRVKPSWSIQSKNNLADEFGAFLQKLGEESENLSSRLAQLTKDCKFPDLAQTESWRDFLTDALGEFSKAVGAWRTEIDYCRDAWDKIPTSPRSQVGVTKSTANAICYQIKALCDKTVIEWFADRRFLPRYGFPINLQSLSVYADRNKTDDSSGSDEGSSAKRDEHYRLQRSSMLALNEYVPGASLIARGKVVTSRGLRKHWTDANINEALGLNKSLWRCSKGHLLSGAPEDGLCRCGHGVNQIFLLEPRWGYTTAAWDPPKRRLDYSVSGETFACPMDFVENPNKGEVFSDFGQIQGLTARYVEEAELLVTNEGKHKNGFAVCTKCGFSMSEDTPTGDGLVNLPKGFDSHPEIWEEETRFRCWHGINPTVLRHKVFAARELTDMLLLEWPGLVSDSAAVSLSRALILAGAKILEVDGREISAEHIPLLDGAKGIVIYDATPGGSGHCLELLNNGDLWIEESKKILEGDQNHGRRCDCACIDCILDFSSQHEEHLLNRNTALALIP